MTVDEFLEEYNGAPFDLEEVADLVKEIEDDDVLREMAIQYLSYKGLLEERLEEIEFEFG